VPRLCEFYPDICLTTEEKARKNLSQGKKNLSQVTKNLSQSTVYILPKQPHIYTHTHTHYKTCTYTHPHITKQYKTTTVQIKTNTVQDIPKWDSHNIIKCPQYKVTLMYLAPLSTKTSPCFTSLHFKIKSLHINHVNAAIRNVSLLYYTRNPQIFEINHPQNSF
jgi:hypothetical protein